MTPEIKQILMHAHDEVVTLRRRIDALAPKAEAYDALLAVINRLSPTPQQSMGVDVAWRIKMLLETTPLTPDADEA